MDKIRLGLIGCGGRAGAHMGSWAKRTPTRRTNKVAFAANRLMETGEVIYFD